MPVSLTMELVLVLSFLGVGLVPAAGRSLIGLVLASCLAPGLVLVHSLRRTFVAVDSIHCSLSACVCRLVLPFASG